MVELNPWQQQQLDCNMLSYVVWIIAWPVERKQRDLVKYFECVQQDAVAFHAL